MPARQRLTILYVEDSLTDLEWVDENLSEHVEIIHATCLAECHRSGECDVALLDLNLADTIGVDTLKKFRSGIPHLPIVVLTHVDDPVLEAECMKAGAHAYYRKGTFDPKALVRSMNAAAIAFFESAERKAEVVLHKKNLLEIRAMTSNILERLSSLE